MRRFLFEYRHDGADWAIEIVASSPDDARARIKALSFARYMGEVEAVVHVPAGGMLLRVAQWLGLIR